ncbi:hypothetical protein ACFV2U_45285 [Streptomyces sp. NPDC059697]|uniref:hypothetical protein n=1 Tax=Streptomyces sp. NPDC059697 TaxID=3346912 RepID=UPI003696F519
MSNALPSLTYSAPGKDTQPPLQPVHRAFGGGQFRALVAMGAIAARATASSLLLAAAETDGAADAILKLPLDRGHLETGILRFQRK